MATNLMPDWQQEALDKMSARLAEWLPDHKLHLVLIRAPFHIPGTKVELTDPAFEQLLESDKQAAHAQLNAEFMADRLASAARDRRRMAEQKAAAEAVKTCAANKRRSRTKRKSCSSAQQSIPLL